LEKARIDVGRYFAAHGGRRHRLRFPLRRDPHPGAESGNRALHSRDALPRAVYRVHPAAAREIELEKSSYAHVQIFVPVDDERTIFYGIFFSQDGSVVDEAAVRADHHTVPGVDLDRNWYKLATLDNWFNQDRVAMKNGSFTGINGFSNQDMALQESMGPIVDRTQEHLGTSDIAIIRMRKRMLEAVRKFQNGEPLIGLTPGMPYDKIRSEQLVVPIEQPWQSVGAYAGEYKPETARA
jgi:hypothetical protein